MLQHPHQIFGAVRKSGNIQDQRFRLKLKLHWLQVTASSSKNVDLLAAMRGGGTAFGVVTEVAFTVHDVSNYHGGVITFKDDINCTTLRSRLNACASSLHMNSKV